MDRLPLWFRIVGFISGAGAIVLTIRLVYEQTLMTWNLGPQMIGFAWAESGEGLPFYLCFFILILWSCVVLARSVWMYFSEGKKISISRWVALFLVICAIAILQIPYTTWERFFIVKLATGPHVEEFLSYAALRGDYITVKHLLNNGLNINATGQNGETALYVAADRGNIEVIKYLLEKGADINAGNKYGVTPLGIAMENRVHSESSSNSAFKNRNEEIVNFLLAHGAHK